MEFSKVSVSIIHIFIIDLSCKFYFLFFITTILQKGSDESIHLESECINV